MKRFAGLLLSFCLVLSAGGDNTLTLQKAYVEKYADMAVAEMYRSGVPASITLAQGLLESGYGRSGLAVQGNNHFGIKCHDWKGKRVYFDDDAKGECFRKYDSVAESYADHSDFLRYRDRYKFLFDLETTDYKGWAQGLKKAGYATDPAYATKLINLIESLELYRWDTAKPSSRAVARTTEDDDVQTPAGNWDRKYVDKSRKDIRESRKEDKAGRKEAKKAERKLKKAEEDGQQDAIPQSPLVLERARPLTKADGHISFKLNREVLQCNGVPFVYSVEGESYYSIAEQYDLFKKEVLRINDVHSDKILLPGTRVYIQAKKSHSARGLDKHIVESDGESLWEISQRYGVKLDEILKMNGFDRGHVLREGDTVYLRKLKD